MDRSGVANKINKEVLPDISGETSAGVAGKLSRVGMGSIEMPVTVQDLSGERFRLPAKISAFVNLAKEDAKGIHMSRLYLVLKDICASQAISLKTIKQILREFIESQKGLSTASYVRIEFDLPIERSALISGQLGWRQYPVYFEGQCEGNEFEFKMGATITYSSTCPCSAALARRLIQNKFSEDFDKSEPINFEMVHQWLGFEQSIAATPHSQRSTAYVEVTVDAEAIAPEMSQLIDCVAFRKLKSSLDKEPRFIDFKIKCEHQESLHPHNAVSEVQKTTI